MFRIKRVVENKTAWGRLASQIRQIDGRRVLRAGVSATAALAALTAASAATTVARKRQGST